VGRRYHSDDDSLGEILVSLLALYLLYLWVLYHINRANFWRWFLYGLVVEIILFSSIFIWRELKYQRRQKRLNNLLFQIKKAGLEKEIQNFINRFGHESGKRKFFEFRGYSFDYYRVRDFTNHLIEKGIKISLDKWKSEIIFILKHYIQEKEEKLTRESVRLTPQRFSNLTPTEFEQLVYRLYEAMGYSVQHVGKAKDQGGDIIANKEGERILIQAKRYIENLVGNKAVQEAVAAKKFYDCNKAIVVATSDFTPEAKELAKANNVELISKKQLQELLLKYLNESWY